MIYVRVRVCACLTFRQIVDGQGNTSAGKKGETLEDTIMCLECYTDVTVLRHPVQGSVGRVMEVATKPVSRNMYIMRQC